MAKKLLEYKSKEEIISVDISNLSKGIYLVSTGNKKLAKFLKE